LKKLDELHDDRGARLAADQTLAECFGMAKNTSNTAATAIGMNALKPIVHFQVSMIRIWADSIERFAGNYEKGLEETATTVGEQSDKQRAA
jgi:hypothetical protein